jgi:O-antigen/teichoic acid export membrane protein
MNFIFSKIVQHRPLLARFFRGQLIVQFFNLLNGFLLLRWLSIEDQAIFSVSFGMQTLINQLSDLGFSGSIIALTGERFNDKAILGGFIRSAKHYRRILFLVSVVMGVLLVPLFSKTNFSNSYVLWINLIPVLAGVYWQANSGIYASPLIIHKKMKDYYRPQLITSAIRLSLNYALFLTHHISSLSILILNALIILYIGNRYKKYASEFFDSDAPVKESRQKMFKYILPLIPSLIFNAFFGQIQIFIISFFGKVRNIAEVAALGKLSQIFLLLAAFNMMIVEPMIAKSKGNDLLKKYLVFFIFSGTLATLLTMGSYFFPKLFLLALGSKYANLSQQLIWVIGASAISFVSSTLWTMNSARKWLFWWGTIFYIAMIVATQILGIISFDISTTMGVLQLSFLTAVGILIVQCSIGVFGLIKNMRKEATDVSLVH